MNQSFHFHRKNSIEFLFVLVCLNYCYNNGVCTIIGSTPNCTCSGSFGGIRCQSVLTTTPTPPPSTTLDPACAFMPADYCKNNGSCLVQSGVFACYCSPLYTGKYCESPSVGPGISSHFSFKIQTQWRK